MQENVCDGLPMESEEVLNERPHEGASFSVELRLVDVGELDRRETQQSVADSQPRQQTDVGERRAPAFVDVGHPAAEVEPWTVRPSTDGPNAARKRGAAAETAAPADTRSAAGVRLRQSTSRRRADGRRDDDDDDDDAGDEGGGDVVAAESSTAEQLRRAASDSAYDRGCRTSVDGSSADPP